MLRGDLLSCDDIARVRAGFDHTPKEAEPATFGIGSTPFRVRLKFD